MPDAEIRLKFTADTKELAIARQVLDELKTDAQQTVQALAQLSGTNLSALVSAGAATGTRITGYAQQPAGITAVKSQAPSAGAAPIKTPTGRVLEPSGGGVGAGTIINNIYGGGAGGARTAEVGPVQVPPTDVKPIRIPVIVDKPVIPPANVVPIKIPVEVEKPQVPAPDLVPIKIQTIVDKPVVPDANVVPIKVPVEVQKPVVPEPDRVPIRLTTVVDKPVIPEPNIVPIKVPVSVDRPQVPTAD